MEKDIKFLERQLVGGSKRFRSLNDVAKGVKETVTTSGVKTFLKKRDTACILALAMKESGFGQSMLNPDSGAAGWLQFVPNTYKGLGQYVIGDNEYAAAVRARCRHFGFTTVLAMHTPSMRQVMCDDFATAVALARLNHRYLASFLRKLVDKGLILNQEIVDHLYAIGHHVPVYMVKLAKSLPMNRRVTVDDIHNYVRLNPTWKGNPMLADYEKFIRFYRFAQDITEVLWG